MSREIEFRIYDKGRKEWVHGPGDEVNLFGETILCGELLRRDSDDTHVKLQDLNDMVALQFTGLKDKNGVEIYEGDVIRVDNFDMVGWEDSGDPDSPHEIYEDVISSVLFEKGSFSFESQQCGVIPLEFAGDGTVEVIGNIYSNPELLQK